MKVKFCVLIKIVLKCVLISLLLLITYSRFLKIWEEQTGLSYSLLDANDGAELPSFTGKNDL